ncbi:MAG: hypothetical protein K2W96_02610 [Gemmataceae bacterium]|nr:hypothetical protein [Gemmataceae bacterium]
MVELGGVSWGELFWVPLMDDGAEGQVIRRWLGLVDRLAPTPKAKADLKGIALVFAGLVGKGPEWRRVMGASLYTESEVVNEWIDHGLLKATRDNLGELIQEQMPEAWTPDVQKAIADQPSLALLRQWFRAALAAERPRRSSMSCAGDAQFSASIPNRAACSGACRAMSRFTRSAATRPGTAAGPRASPWVPGRSTSRSRSRPACRMRSGLIRQAPRRGPQRRPIDTRP